MLVHQRVQSFKVTNSYDLVHPQQMEIHSFTLNIRSWWTFYDYVTLLEDNW